MDPSASHPGEGGKGFPVSSIDAVAFGGFPSALNRTPRGGSRVNPNLMVWTHHRQSAIPDHK